MEKIQKFENCKIEDLQNIYGGRVVSNTTSGKIEQQEDKKITYDDGSFTIVENLGLWNWLSGDRTSKTYQYNKDTNVYTADPV